MFSILCIHFVIAQLELTDALSPSAKQTQNPCPGPPHVYQDLSTRYDWPVQNPNVDLPIRLKGNSEHISGN